MSYNVGQFRRTQLPVENYVQDLEYSMDVQSTNQDFLSGNVSFKDSCAILEGLNVLNSQNNYYLKFKIKHRKDSPQSFNIKIRNSEGVEDNFQNIQGYSVDQDKTQNVVWSTFELIIAPNATYNQIIFELNRIAIDYITESADGSYGRTAEIEILQFQVIENIVSYLGTTYNGLRQLAKIGVQGPTGLLMCINGEEIRIGKSGIYEINNGMVIQFIGFIIKTDEATDTTETFIMDFQY